MPSPERRLDCSYLGRLPYRQADSLQQALRQRVRAEAGVDYLLLLEHPHVFTLGRNASRDDIVAGETWLCSRRVEIEECDRGGKVTYHGPGQLVGYPIVDLDPDRRDLRRYVRDLQEVLVRTLADVGVEACARGGEEIGIWVESRKIASIGVHVSRWITTHGFALNLHTDLAFFSGIVPCGLGDVEMTSVERCTGRRWRMETVAERSATHFAEVFDRRLRWTGAEELLEKCPIAS